MTLPDRQPEPRHHFAERISGAASGSRPFPSRRQSTLLAGGGANSALIAAIGPSTTEAIRRHGRERSRASAATIGALHDAVVAYLTRYFVTFSALPSLI